MVHISELSWQRIKNPSEVVLVGDTVEVYVKALDPEKRKISLGYKKAEDNPWVIFENNYHVGDTVKVTIVSMTTYGAFARIIPGIDGLIHISQIDVDPEKKRVSLSIRALLEPEKAEEEAPAVSEPDETVYETPAEAPAAEEAPAEAEE